MGVLLDFNFLAILNLFVLLLWPSFVPLVATDKRTALNLIMVIITVIVVLGDIFFLVLKVTGH
jgi:hypothetical protein